jgi:hypothetical protein
VGYDETELTKSIQEFRDGIIIALADLDVEVKALHLAVVEAGVPPERLEQLREQVKRHLDVSRSGVASAIPPVRGLL